MRRIVLVTRQFPYGKSETFLETEIKILSKHFESIIIYPSTKSDSIRTLPDNVKVDNLIADEYVRKSKWLIKTLFSIQLYVTFKKYYKRLKSINSVLHLVKYCTSYNIYAHCLRRDFSQYSNEIIYSYWFSPFVDAAIKEVAFSNVVTRVHRGDLYEEISILGFFPYRGEVIHRVAAVISISDDGERYINKKYSSKNVVVSKLGVNNFSEGISTSSPEFSSTKTDSINFASASNVISVKNVDFIAQCIVSYANKHNQKMIKWIHFGDGEFLGVVKKIISDYNGINLQCEFPGRISNTLIYKYYENNKVDVFLNLSDSEGIPVSIMEAISFGIPIIATDVGGVNEIVNTSNGILLKHPPTEYQVTEALANLVNYPKNSTEIKKFWFDNFSADNNYDQFSKLLKGIYFK